MGKMHQPKSFTMVSNTIRRDKRLKLKEKGMMLVLLGLPDGWEFKHAPIFADSADGKDAHNSALQRLEEVGYIYRERTRRKDGSFDTYDYWLSHEPRSQKAWEEHIRETKAKKSAPEDVAAQTEKPAHKPSSPQSGKPDVGQKPSSSTSDYPQRVSSSGKPDDILRLSNKDLVTKNTTTEITSNKAEREPDERQQQPTGGSIREEAAAQDLLTHLSEFGVNASIGQCSRLASALTDAGLDRSHWRDFVRQQLLYLDDGSKSVRYMITRMASDTNIKNFVRVEKLKQGTGEVLEKQIKDQQQHEEVQDLDESKMTLDEQLMHKF